jgi:uncharacterized damage-inducible protein DinB
MQVDLDQVLEMWRSHEAVNRYLLAHTPDAGLDAVPLLKTGKPSKGRTIARNWAHIYESRLAHLRKREKQLMKGAPEFGKGYSPTRKEIEKALAQSSIGVEARLTNALADGELIRTKQPLVFLAYQIAHESHHRGQMLLALKQSGFAPSEELRWGIWGLWFG